MPLSSRVSTFLKAPTAWAVVVALTLGNVGFARASAVTLDSVDAVEALSKWQFSNGSEFAGASGELLFSEDDGDGHLVLRYDFTMGGVYVAATRNLDSPVELEFLRLEVVLPDVATLAVRVRDASGQWLQYPVSRALGPIRAGQWQRVVVPLRNPTSFWDGAADGELHQPVSTVSFVVDSEAVGEVWLDDVEGLELLDVALDPSLPLAQVPPEAQNLMAGFAVAVHDLSDNASLDAAELAGFTWARTDLFWQWVETSVGEYNFAPFDSFLARLDERGMSALFILDYGNELHGGGPPVTPDAQRAFINFATAAAQRYAERNVVFEIWNEPDTDRFWPPESDAVAFAQLVSATAQAIRSVAPGTGVVTGGLSWFDFEYLESMFGAGAATYVDAIGVHPYRGTSAPETLVAHVLTARALMERELGATLPLWDTEWGYSATQFGPGDDEGARTRQAVLAVRRMLVSRLLGLPLATWYDLKDDGSDPANAEHNFGLLTENGMAKPAYQALIALQRAAVGRSVAGLINVAQPLLCGVKLVGTSDSVFVLWSTYSGMPINVSVPTPSHAWDMLGNSIPVLDSYSLEEATGPVYLQYVIDANAQPGDAGATQTSHAADAAISSGSQSDAALATSPMLDAAAGNDETLPRAQRPDAYAEAGALGEFPEWHDGGHDGEVSGSGGLDQAPGRRQAGGCGCRVVGLGQKSVGFSSLCGVVLLLIGRRRISVRAQMDVRTDRHTDG